MVSLYDDINCTSRTISLLYEGTNFASNWMVFARASSEDPIMALRRKIRKNRVGMSASVTEKARDDAAARSLFF